MFFSANNAFAQNTATNYDVTVSPVFFDLTSNPGGTITDKVRIRNNTTSALPIIVGVKKLTGDENGDLTLKDTSSDNSLSWINFPQSKIVVAPLEWQDVNFTITIPKDAAYGYYFAITFSQENSNKVNGAGTLITGSAAVPILLNVKKEGAKAEANIVDFSTTSFVNEYLPVNFNVKIQNVGNIHVLPHGNIFISDGGNKDVAVLDVNANGGNIIPGTNRNFNTSWDDGFLVKEPVIVDGLEKIDKNGKPEENLVINWDKITSFRIGKYTANLILVFDNGTRDVSLEKTISFWVFPYKAVLGFLIGVIILVLILRFILKSYINRELKKRSR